MCLALLDFHEEGVRAEANKDSCGNAVRGTVIFRPWAEWGNC